MRITFLSQDLGLKNQGVLVLITSDVFFFPKIFIEFE